MQRIDQVPRSIMGAKDWHVPGQFQADGAVHFGGEMTTASGVGSIPAVSGLSVEEFGDGIYHRTKLILDGVVLATLDNGTAGAGGGTKLYDFPRGAVLIVGATQNWSRLTLDGTGLTNVADVDIGLGTTAATSAMASLTGTTQDILAKLDLTFSTSLSALHKFLSTVSAGNVLAGQVTAKDAYINVACSVATSDANGTIVLTGTVEILWVNLGVATS